MNLFEVTGGEFLIFYAAFGVAVLALAYVLRPDRRVGDAPDLSDRSDRPL